MLWVDGKIRLCALNCMALWVTAVLMGVRYLVLSFCNGSKGTHTGNSQDCPQLGIMQLRDDPRALVVAVRKLLQPAYSKQQATSEHVVLSCGAICFVLAVLDALRLLSRSLSIAKFESGTERYSPSHLIMETLAL